MLDPRLRAACDPGALVWERLDVAVESFEDRPRRGGTVLEFDARRLAVTVCAGTPVSRQKINVATVDLRLEELDPQLTEPAEHRIGERTALARKLLRAVSESKARQRTGYDDRLVAWAMRLWDVSYSKNRASDCGGGVCTLFGEPCDGCSDRAVLAMPAEAFL